MGNPPLVSQVVTAQTSKMNHYSCVFPCKSALITHSSILGTLGVSQV